MFSSYPKEAIQANRKDLQALTLVGPTRENPVLDPLAVLHLDNWLCMKNSRIFTVVQIFI